ncbi:glutamyl-tRNA(Gln) amidotransferase subunit A [Rhizoctonia solani 123E]|uniref:Glutamyl-tRNA(Gln) amidotransferase subunit A n=1 Tax=Rhizoctonia solani 123E TaxID=1423351 RepID=A0A074RT26_9AGAM|nr:glutamyl-tRNA(Gln) amidotransferase subunit A [Rhizoctonia solani 123E]
MTNTEQSSAPSTLDSLTNTNGSKPIKLDWETAAALKRDDRANRLKPYAHWSLDDLTPPSSQKNVASLVHARLTDRERSFLASDVTDLAGRLAAKECTAVEVTTAFCKATYAAQELTNCVTEVIFTQALARAQELDAHMSETGKVVGPLHGIPVSIKDHISVKGEDTATGFVAWAGRTVAEKDATIVQILRAAGAVIYVKTTNPQSLFALETCSNIYGNTTNPYNRDLTCGGSSGGEGALIGSRASLLGVGTDIGGSIVSLKMIDFACPSAYCGLYGLKPSSHRLPASGLARPCQGMENIVGVIGPMAHSARDLELFFKVVSESKPWNMDFGALCMPWNPVSEQGGENEKLVIGFFADDGVVAPHPPIVERLRKTREALVAAGHEVVDWTPMDHMEAFETVAKLYMIDGGDDIRATLAESGEPPIPQVAGILPDPSEKSGCTLAESWDMNIRRDQFRAKALKHWNETALRSNSGRPVDVVLCPATPTLAAPHGTTRWIGYTAYWNLLDLPAVVFPSGKPFDASTWEPATNSVLGEPRNPFDEFVTAQWNPETYDGAPIGLQLVGRRWQEENLLAALKHVEDAVAQFE